jgi:hypothetical protein
MYCVVPLAGPDFYHESYGIKPFLEYKGKALIESILSARSWYPQIETFIFALQDDERSRSCAEVLQRTFPSSRFVFISNFTRGALLSSLSAVSLIDDFTKPLVVDLVDIDYDSSDFRPLSIFSDGDVKGIVPYFISDDPCYSYLLTDQEEFLLESAEKRLISNKASAGTYFFRDLGTFFSVLEGSIKQESRYSYKNSLFLCPVYNEIVQRNGKVFTNQVPLISSISKGLKSLQTLQNI